MSKRNRLEILLDINEAIRRIMEHTKNIRIEDFFNDTKTQDAVTRNIEII